MKPLVSILIPAYNAEKWIGEAIESALAQDWKDKEVIIIDDGSQDSTFHVARSYSSRNVKIVRQTHSGASAARNRALSIAQGDYIQWLDADDLLEPYKISRQLRRAREKSLYLVSGAWGRFYHKPSNASFKPDELWDDLAPAEWLYRKINYNRWMAIESWLVSRKLTEKAGPWNESLSLDDDGEYFCRLLAHSSGVLFVPDAVCYCRRSNFGLSHSLTLNNRKLNSLAISLICHIRTLLCLEDSPRTRQACVKLLNRWSIYFYPERMDIFGQLKGIAHQLGVDLGPPRLRPKYQWIQYILGWRAAKRAQFFLPTLISHFKNFTSFR